MNGERPRRRCMGIRRDGIQRYTSFAVVSTRSADGCGTVDASFRSAARPLRCYNERIMFGNLVNIHDFSLLAEKARQGRLGELVSRIVSRGASWDHVAYPLKNWWDIPEVMDRWNVMISGDPKVDYCAFFLRRHFADGRDDRSVARFGDGESRDRARAEREIQAGSTPSRGRTPGSRTRGSAPIGRVSPA